MSEGKQRREMLRQVAATESRTTPYEITKLALVGNLDTRIAPQTVRAIKEHLSAGLTPKQAAAKIHQSWKSEAAFAAKRFPIR